MAYITTWEEHGIFWKMTGTTSIDEMVKLSADLPADERFDSAKYYICDGTEVEKVICSEVDDIDIVAAEDAAASTYKPYLKGALVASLPELVDIFERYIKTSKKLSNKWDIRIFSTVQEAREWLKPYL